MLELTSGVMVDITTVIIKVASEVVFKLMTDAIVSKVLKKTTVSKVLQKRLDWFSEASRVYCVSNGPTRREYFRRVSSVKFHQITHICLFGSGS